jgi:DNA (cytosine-5)-methyltransferase 1
MGRSKRHSVRFIDLFCGIGGFRYGIEMAATGRNLIAECLFSSDIDQECQKTYHQNFGEKPFGNIASINAKDIPNHDVLLAGFPCQPFSIIGHRKGFEDTRGTLFFEIARILEEKRPNAFVLENVKMLRGHNGGKTLNRILSTLENIGYNLECKVLNALDFGLPQKRERIWIVGSRKPISFDWPDGNVPMTPLIEILEPDVPQKFFASDRIRKKRWAIHKPGSEPTIWHENKSGHISAYPYSCALRAGASYNYLLVDGERRLTPREMLRLQGFPEYFEIACNDSQTRKQVGNSLPVNVATAVIEQLFIALKWGETSYLAPNWSKQCNQMKLLDEKAKYAKEKTKVKNG